MGYIEIYLCIGLAYTIACFAWLDMSEKGQKGMLEAWSIVAGEPNAIVYMYIGLCVVAVLGVIAWPYFLVRKVIRLCK